MLLGSVPAESGGPTAERLVRELDRSAVPETLIAPGRGGLLGSLVECWRRRELLYFLAWRDIKVRYKQSLLGAAWAVLQPLVTMVVFTLIFYRMAGMQGIKDVPYPVFSLAGLVPWYLFQSVLAQSSNSVVGQGRLISKVYFPRLLIPFSTVGAALVDFVVASVILAGLTAYYALYGGQAASGIAPGWGLLLVPVFVLFAVLAALSVGIWFAALTAKYRDFRFIAPFLMRIGLFITPVAYSSSEFISKTRLPAWCQSLYSLNPMVGVLEGFRWALFGGTAGLDVGSVLTSVGAVLLLLLGGLFFFRKMERQFADLL
jgi:homopolymeric O-antigen transport system permease protein